MNNQKDKQGVLAGKASTVLTKSGDAIAWWLSHLAIFIPAGLKRFWSRDTLTLKIEVKGEQLEIAPAGSFRNKVIISAPWETSNLPTEASKLIHRAQTFELFLPPEMTLQTTLSLPKTAQEHLSNIICFEMDRKTPFKADQVFYDYQTLQTKRNDQQIEVELQLVPKVQLNGLLDNLHKIGITPSRVAPTLFQQRKDFNCNLLPQNNEPSIELKYQRFQWSLLLCNLVLIIAVISLPLMEKEQQIKLLQDEVAYQQNVAEEVFDIRNERETLLSQQQAYVSLRQQQNSSLELIDELTQLLPDSTWLNKVAIQGSSLRIQGEGSNASELIALLENSKQMKSVSFLSPVTQNPRSGKERFMISAQLVSEVKDDTQ